MTKSLAGRIAFVTGARGGIGRAICARLIKEGAQVIAADLSAQGSLGVEPQDGTDFVTFDVTSEAKVRQTMEDIAARYGALDILVNAAGIEIEKSIEETSLEEWNKVFAINVTGTFLTAKYALDLLRKSTAASIINFGSYDGFIADPGLAAYCASKGAVHALTKAMACDHGPEGIRVNAICPGYIDTPMLQSFFAGEGSGGDGGSIEDLQLANLVYWLASDEARYASGQLWVLDGGLSAQVQQMKL